MVYESFQCPSKSLDDNIPTTDPAAEPNVYAKNISTESSDLAIFLMTKKFIPAMIVSDNIDQIILACATARKLMTSTRYSTSCIENSSMNRSVFFTWVYDYAFYDRSRSNIDLRTRVLLLMLRSHVRYMSREVGARVGMRDTLVVGRLDTF